MPPPVCHHAWLSTELDMLSGIIHSLHLQSLFSVLSIFSYFRLKVASAKCLLDLKHLSQNTSTLPDTRAHKYAFQCYSLIFTFKSRIFSLESTTSLSNTWLCGLTDVLSKYRAFCTYIYEDWNGGETSLLILELGTVGRAEMSLCALKSSLQCLHPTCVLEKTRLANKLCPKDLNSASWGHPLLRVCWWGRPGMDRSPPVHTPSWGLLRKCWDAGLYETMCFHTSHLWTQQLKISTDLKWFESHGQGQYQTDSTGFTQDP